MTKILIEGDLTKEHVRYICKYLVKEFKGKKEHIDVLVEDDEATLKSVKGILKEIWK